MSSLIKTSFSLLSPRLRRQWYMHLPLSLAAAALESVGAALVYLAIQIIHEPDRIGTLPLVGGFYPIPPDSATAVIHVALALAMFFLGKNAFLVLVWYHRHLLIGTSTASFSRALLGRYVQADYVFHLQHNSADLIRNTMDSSAVAASEGLGSVVALTHYALTGMGLLLVLMFAAPLAMLVVAAALSVLLYLIARIAKTRIDRHSSHTHKARKDALQKVQQALRALAEIRIAGKEGFFLDDFSKAQNRYARGYTHAMTWTSASSLAVEALLSGAAAAVLAMLAVVQGMQATELLPVLAIYAYAAFRLIPSMKGVVYHWGLLQYARVYIERINLHAALAPAVPAIDDPGVLHCDRRIILSNLCFRYPNSSRPAIQDCSGEIRSGESVGLVGASGAGKTTLILLLLGLLVPERGRIVVDGRDIREQPRRWRHSIGYVPQDTYLLDDTLRRNIALGHIDEDIDEARLRSCVAMAQLETVVAALPQGLDTCVGENGARLSGGQRQRLAIARALYRQPSLLVLDEATSSLDNETETAVTQALKALHGRITMVVIAHRASTIRECDKLFFLKNGRLDDVGTFAELYARNRQFRRMTDPARILISAH